MNVIFLDIDGVLNHRLSSQEMLKRSPWTKETENELVGLFPPLVNNLKKVVDNAVVKIVFSTSWRYFKDHPTVGDDWRKSLAEMLSVSQDLFIGDTPVLGGWKNRRGREILKWMSDNDFHGKYIVIDDNIEDIENVISKDMIIHTDGNRGFTAENADEVIRFFRK